MKKFYLTAILIWLLNVVLAIGNAVVRELIYQPWLEPKIGSWAHQLSILPAIIIFSLTTYWFLKINHDYKYQPKDLFRVGIGWCGLTFIFETILGVFYRQMSLNEILTTYNIFRGELWVLVLIYILFSPVILDYLMNLKTKSYL